MCVGVGGAAAAGCPSQSDRPKLSPAGLKMKADAPLVLLLGFLFYRSVFLSSTRRLL